MTQDRDVIGNYDWTEAFLHPAADKYSIALKQMCTRAKGDIYGGFAVLNKKIDVKVAIVGNGSFELDSGPFGGLSVADLMKSSKDSRLARCSCRHTCY